MPSLSPEFLNRLQFSTAHMRVMRDLGDYRGRQALFIKQSPEELHALRQIALIESSESSNRIEGIIAPYSRIKALILQTSTAQNRSEQEVSGYRDALALIHESAPHMTFTPNVILQLHSKLYRYLSAPGGHFKSTNNDIIETGRDGTQRIRFKPTPAHLTPDQMQTLSKDYGQAMILKQEPLICLPLAILDFLCIHPFSDGNGRMSRLLTLMLLYHFDYQVGRYISLERIFEDSKETYYETLEQSSISWHESKHDVLPWLSYFWGVLSRAYQEFEERVGTVQKEGGRGTKTRRIRAAIERQIIPFSIKDIENECPAVSREMIKRVLQKMRGEGEVALEGKGRGAKWHRTV